MTKKLKLRKETWEGGRERDRESNNETNRKDLEIKTLRAILRHFSRKKGN